MEKSPDLSPLLLSASTHPAPVASWAAPYGHWTEGQPGLLPLHNTETTAPGHFSSPGEHGQGACPGGRARGRTEAVPLPGRRKGQASGHPQPGLRPMVAWMAKDWEGHDWKTGDQDMRGRGTWTAICVGKEHVPCERSAQGGLSRGALDIRGEDHMCHSDWPLSSVSPSPS